jgi:hypothetical protein
LTLSHNSGTKFCHQLHGSVEHLSLIVTLGQDFVEPSLYIPLTLHLILAVSEVSTNFYLTEQLQNFFLPTQDVLFIARDDDEQLHVLMSTLGCRCHIQCLYCTNTCSHVCLIFVIFIFIKIIVIFCLHFKNWIYLGVI